MSDETKPAPLAVPRLDVDAFPPILRPWIEGLAIHKELSDEIYELVGYVRGSGPLVVNPTSLSQTKRRMFVRSVFAYIEGVSFTMKGIAFLITPEVFDLGERLLIEETQYRLKDNGKVKKEKARLRTEDSVRFAFASLHKAVRKDWDLKTERVGWELLDEMVDRRNQLTHPRKASQLHIDDPELEKVAQVFRWFGDENTKIMYWAAGVSILQAVLWLGKTLHEQAEHAKAEAEIERLKAELEALKSENPSLGLEAPKA